MSEQVYVGGLLAHCLSCSPTKERSGPHKGERYYHVWCRACNTEHVSWQPDRRLGSRVSQAAVTAEAAGWVDDKERGWLCPQCQGQAARGQGQ